MFCVYGRSRPLAKKKVYKFMEDVFSDISIELRGIESRAQSCKQDVIDNYIEHEFNTMKPKKCTHEFAAPEFCKEAYDLMKVDKFNFGDLILMKKIEKTKGVTRSKKTNKIMLEWVKLNG